MNLWVFDNDGTLYDDFGAGKKFMEILLPYASKLLQVSVDQTETAINQLKVKWNTEFSVLALVKELNIDFNEIVENTYLKVDLELCGVYPNSATKTALKEILSPKIVFTNNPSKFAKYVLSYLELNDQFTDFIGMEELNFQSKPALETYRTVEKLYPQYDQFYFCDDSLKNLDAAHQLGWKTFWLKQPKDYKLTTSIHFTIESLSELKNFI